MLNEIVFEVHEAEEGGYYTAAVGHDIITQGDSWEELKLMAQDALLCHFDADAPPTTLRLRLANLQHRNGGTQAMRIEEVVLRANQKQD